MNSKKLSGKLWWSITPIVLLLMAIQGIFSLVNLINLSEIKAEAIVTRHITQQVARTQNYLKRFKATVTLLSKNEKLHYDLMHTYEQTQLSTEAQKESIGELNHYINSFSDILSIGLISPQGESGSFVPRDPFASHKKYEFEKQIIESDKDQNLFFIEEKGKTSIYLTHRLFNPNHSLVSPKVIGYLIIHIESKEIEQSVGNIYYSDSINFIINNEGKVLFSNQPEYRNKVFSENELKLLKEVSENAQDQNKSQRLHEFSELSLPTFKENERMVISHSMDNGFYFVTALNRNSLYGSAKTITIYTGLMIIFTAIFLSWLIYFLVHRLLLEPIESLAKASNQVGDGDLELRLEIDRDDEIGMLFQDFNHMVDQIKQYQNQLIDYREHLEDKVTTRTNALGKINKKLEKAITEAEQANNLKSRFLANMSHEIRTPLTAIMGFTESTLAQEADQDKSAYLNTVLRNSKHLLELINNILDLSKIEADKFEFETRPVEVLALINDVETIIKPLATRKQLDFSINIDFPLPDIIHSDATRLRQILLNISSNAVKFTDKGHVTISLKYCQTTEKLIFTVIDSGIGMTEQEQARIFKPFEQADISTTRKFGGTGLGLCIAKNLAQILGGDISVESKPNKGSKFVIEIATYNKDHKITMITHSQLPISKINEPLLETSQHLKGRILVAEDNEDNQHLIGILLSECGMSPQFVSNGVEAVEKALFEDFDLILMDMQMPVMGGLEATKVLRSAGYHGPIVALTANVMKKDTDAYLAAGCNKTLAKPIDREQFEQVLNQYLSLKMKNEWYQVFSADPSYLEEISNNYKTKLPNLLVQITQLHKQQNHKALVDVAHSIKGSAGSFGFTDITQAAADVEDSIRNNSDDKINDSVLGLMKEIELGIES